VTLDEYEKKLAREGFTLVKYKGRDPSGEDAICYELSHPDGRAAHGWVTMQAVVLTEKHPTTYEALWLSHLRSARRIAQEGKL
jgi:hypothetical protein